MLRRYIPALRSTTDATEQLRIITEFAARGFEIAEAQAETTSGAIAQMMNAVSDLAEVAAQPILEPMTEDAKGLKILIEGATEGLKKYQEAAERTDKASKRWDFMRRGFPPGVPMIHKGMPMEPEAAGKAAGKGLPEVIRFEEPEWVKATLALNVMTEAQKKAAASMYEMSMKARGLGEELAREKKITQFAGLAKVRYGADVAGAQAAEERFTKALRESEAAKIAAAAEEKKRLDALKVERIQLELDMKRWDDVARAMEDSFANAFEAMAFEAKKFGDVMKAVARDILMEMMRIMIFRPAAQELADWLTPALSGLAGALFGPTAGAAGGPPTTAGVQQYALGGYGGGLQHGGTVIKTGWAEVHRGEKFSGVGGGGNLDVHIHNEGEGKFEISEVEEYAISDQRIIDVTIRAAGTHGPFRRSIKQIR